MIVESIRVQNFRSIRDQTLALDELTMLVGPNGAGKSSFLKALNLFHTPSAAYNEDDFYNKDSSREIVTVCNIRLPDHRREGIVPQIR